MLQLLTGSHWSVTKPDTIPPLMPISPLARDHLLWSSVRFAGGAHYSPPYGSSCGGRMSPVSQNSQSSRQKVPLSATPPPAAFNAARHHWKKPNKAHNRTMAETAMSSGVPWKTFLLWLAQKLCDTNLCCRQRSDPAPLSAPG